MRTYFQIVAIALMVLLLSRCTRNKPYYLEFEAENGIVTHPLSIEEDSLASGGKYVWRSRETSYWEFEVPVRGTYKLWFRVHSWAGNEDSYVVTVNGKKFLWNDFKRNLDGWEWISATEGRLDPQKINFDLKVGKNILEIAQRDQDNPWLDKIVFTNDTAYVPDTDSQKEGYVYIELEGEDAEVPGKLFDVYEESTAHGGKYIAPANDSCAIEFKAKANDEHIVWARVYAESHAANSFFVNLNSKKLFVNHFEPERWQWFALLNSDSVNDEGKRYIKKHHIEKGNNILVFKGKESGCMIDKVIITNDLDYIPED